MKKGLLTLLVGFLLFSGCEKEAIDGKNSLVALTFEQAGENCPSGGYKITTGIDLNNNNILDENEIQNTEYICNGEDGNYDQQIRLTLLDLGPSVKFGNYGSTSGYLIGELDKFNKKNWFGVDSIVFITNIHSTNSSHTAFAELYDVTNDIVIENSTVGTNSTNLTKLESGNFINNLPEEEIDISIRLRIENSSSTAFISGRSYLLLYRAK